MKLLCVLAAVLGNAALANSAPVTRPAILMPAGEAPREGMIAGSWASGLKQIVGSAYESYDSKNTFSSASETAPISKVWFTGAQGTLSEVFWPTVDKAQTRDSQFLVTDGSSFLFEERKDARTSVEWLEPGVPVYVVTNRDPKGRFAIEKTIFTDPDRDVVIQKIKIFKNVPGLKFYYLHNPSVANSSMGDSALASLGAAPGQGLYAWQGEQAQAVLFSAPLLQVSSGFEGANDGYQDLVGDFRMDSYFERATNGNVALMAWIDVSDMIGTSEFEIYTGFGSSIAGAAAAIRATMAKTSDAALAKYIAQWKKYQATVHDLSAQSTDHGVLFRSSVAILKSLEDKTYEGAFVAAPGTPWGLYQQDTSTTLGPVVRPVLDAPAAGCQKPIYSDQHGGYHLVWPRDLYQMATTFMALGDYKSAQASLQFYKRTQLGPDQGSWCYGTRQRNRDGSWVQNMWVGGAPFWNNLQMDQTAMPVVLTYRLWKAQQIKISDYWDMVRRAADFIESYGPWTSQERWEENYGASPSTIAAEIAALWTAAEIADVMGDANRAQRYRLVADHWNSKPDDNLESWTFTTTGKHGNGKYYMRIEGAAPKPDGSPYYDRIWNPNDSAMLMLANGGGFKLEKDVTDGGFFELVRFGVRRATDYHVMESLQEYDATLRVNTSVGPGFFRYLGDRYNYDDLTGAQTKGMLWPLLTGERGHFELARAAEEGRNAAEMDGIVVPYIQAMELFSTPSHMIPEQVWDSGPGEAKPTGAATPLGWAHGEYIKLLRAREGRMVPDHVPVVEDRARMLQNLTWEQIRSLDR